MALDKNSNESNWISFSDIMTGLMVIFMFIAISYMVEADNRISPLRELGEIREELYDTLKTEFDKDFNDWGVDLERDLSMKFTKLEGIFDEGEADIKAEFQSNLNEFVPRYFDILLQDKYRGYIAEIRIEGHTNPNALGDNEDIKYMFNLKLSQRRSAEVLKYIRNMPYYKDLPELEQDILQFWLTANGLSYGRTLDENKELTFFSEAGIDMELSKRVEFRVVTISESLVEEFNTRK